MKETIVNINKTKSWLFEKINIIDEPIARLIKEKREKNPINKSRNDKGKVTTLPVSRVKAKRVLPRECTGHNKNPFLTTQEKTLHMDITRWWTPKSDRLYSL